MPTDNTTRGRHGGGSSCVCWQDALADLPCIQERATVTAVLQGARVSALVGGAAHAAARTGRFFARDDSKGGGAHPGRARERPRGKDKGGTPADNDCQPPRLRSGVLLFIIDVQLSGGWRTCMCGVYQSLNSGEYAQHPGGSGYIAIKVNEAKDMLLGKRRSGGSVF